MNDEIQRLTLEEALTKAKELNWKLALFCDQKYPYTADTFFYIAAPDEYELIELDGKRYEYTLMVQDLQGIVENARQQKPDANSEDLVNAFNYYMTHDAFIDFSK